MTTRRTEPQQQRVSDQLPTNWLRGASPSIAIHQLHDSPAPLQVNVARTTSYAATKKTQENAASAPNDRKQVRCTPRGCYVAAAAIAEPPLSVTDTTMKNNEDQWKSIKIKENVWKSMNIIENQSESMKIKENTWTTMKINEALTKSPKNKTRRT